MNALKNRAELTAMNIVNAIVGAGLFLSPWLFGFSDHQTASWNAWTVGLLVAIVAVAAVAQLQAWEEWVNLALGAWLIVSPWILGFTALASAFWCTLAAGLVVAVLAAVELWLLHDDRTRVTA
ncbi:SPW repeat protein [Enterovirga aerilata]|uniref:SPW repeat protein n=1 Tax=Enterovirga aerilata TaxID=2730920 RepID=A0A849IGX1_9HYPH|nr:SPW repeat protein [Enterovirga sp. DB1703]NNM75187.1 SPW repeat protein [Enterovirga sp. DB1703]